MSRLLNFNRVLCLSPHPDDVELGMMGTIFKYPSTFFDILCMTKGGAKGFDPTNLLNRINEVNNAWEVAKCNNINILHSDCNYFEDKEGTAGWVNWIETNVLSKGNYDCIFLPTTDDSMYEHKFVQSLGYPLTRVNAISLIEYKTVSSLNTWSPNLFINIENEYNRKIQCLKEFTSQQQKSYFREDVLKTFHLNFQHSKKGIELLESFKILELIS